MATCCRLLLSMKVALLVAIKSTRRVSEIAALTADLPFTRFHKDKVVLWPHPKILPKLPSSFHFNEPINLPVFFPKPHTNQTEAILHTLDLWRAIALYQERTKQIWKTKRLFISNTERTQGLPISSQRISKWIVECKKIIYSVFGKEPPAQLAASTACVQGISLSSICKSATWSSTNTFAAHYAMNSYLCRETAF